MPTRAAETARPGAATKAGNNRSMVSVTRAGGSPGPGPGASGILIALAAALAPAAAAAQPAPPDLLRAVAAQVFIVNPATAKNAVCQGYVAEVRPPNAYVATAKHCIADLSLRPLANGTPLTDYGVRVTVRFERGPDAAMTALVWNNSEDIAVVVAPFDPAVKPDSYAALCPACKAARAAPPLRAVSWVFLTGDTLTPSLEAGTVIRGPGGRYVWEHACGARGRRFSTRPAAISSGSSPARTDTPGSRAAARRASSHRAQRSNPSSRRRSRAWPRGTERARTRGSDPT